MVNKIKFLILNFKFSAADCKQRRPGAVFAKTVSTVKPEVIDKEYEAFISDLGGKSNDSKKVKTDSYVPPMGDLSQSFEDSSKPLMLTNGSGAPGAASAFARSQNNAPMQQQGTSRYIFF